MNERKKTSLTPAAEEALNEAAESYKRQISKFISENKFLPGADVIEVTAHDIKVAQQVLAQGKYVDRRAKARRTLTLGVSIIYSVAGACLAVYGILYPQIDYFFREGGPERKLYVFMGVVVMLAGALFPLFSRYMEMMRSARSRYFLSSDED